MSTQNKNFFFTSVPGTDRFLSGDEPTQAVMEDFTDSIPFKLEEGDTATELQQGLVESATQAEYDTSIDNNGLGYALFVRPSFIKTAFTALEAMLQSQIDAINSLILGIQGDISTIQTTITTMQGDITTLQGDVSTITTSVSNSMPIGSMIMFPSDTPPNADWLLCDGQSVATIDYPDLFTITGYTFGGGAGSMQVPNMSEQFIVGWSQFGPAEYNTIGGGMGPGGPPKNPADPTQNAVTLTGTESGQSLQNPAIVVSETTTGAHSHNVTINVRDGGSSGIEGLIGRNSNQGTITITGAADGEGRIVSTEPAHNHSVSATTSIPAASAASAHENRPDFVTFPFYIKAK